jgi:Domain of unknown function (DUF4349)
MRKLVFIVLVVVAAVTVAGCSSGGDEGEGGAGGTGVLEAGGAAPSAVAADATGAGKALPSAQRNVSGVPEIGPQIVQTSSVRLSVQRDRFDETVDEARSIAAGLGGFVVSSSASQGTSQRLVRGTLVLRIPARSYAEAMKALASLGRVESRRENGQDVSQEFVDLRARIRQLQAVESQLLELLDRANTVGAALAVQQQLSQVQLDLEQARGRVQYLDDQVAFSTISLDLHERVLPVPKSGGGRFGIVDAWSKAASGFLAVLGWTFVVLATAAPLVLILAVALFLARVAFHKRLRWPSRRPA